MATNEKEFKLKITTDLKQTQKDLDELEKSLETLNNEEVELISKEQIDNLKTAQTEVDKVAKKIDDIGDKKINPIDSQAMADSLEKAAKGLTDLATGIVLVVGASEEDTKKLMQTMSMTLGIAQGLKGGIEALGEAKKLWAMKTQLATAAQVAMQTALNALKGPLGWITLAVAAAGAAVAIWYKNAKDAAIAAVKLAPPMSDLGKLHLKMNESVNESSKSFTKEIVQLDILRTKINNSVKGSKERKDAINELNREYKPYLKNLADDKMSQEELGKFMDIIKEKIKERISAMATESLALKLQTEIQQQSYDLQNKNLSLYTREQEVRYNLYDLIKKGGANALTINKELQKGQMSILEIATKYTDTDFKESAAFTSLQSVSKEVNTLTTNLNSNSKQYEILINKITKTKSPTPTPTPGTVSKEDVAETSSNIDSILSLQEELRNKSTDIYKEKDILLTQTFEKEAKSITDLIEKNKIAAESNKNNKTLTDEERKKLDDKYREDQKNNYKQLELLGKKFDEDRLKNQEEANQAYSQLLEGRTEENIKQSKELYDIDKAALDNQLYFDELSVDGVGKTDEEKYNIKLKYYQDLLELAKKSGQDTLQIEKDMAALQATEAERIKEKKKADAEAWRDLSIDIAEQIANAGLEIFSNAEAAKTEIALQEIQNRYDAEVKATNDKFDVESSNYKQMLDWKQISQQEYDAKIATNEAIKEQKLKNIEDRKIQQEKELKTKQAKTDKSIGLFKIAIDTAVGIAKAWTLPPPANVIQSIAVGAAGAIQAGIVAAQPIPKFATGGRVIGNNHSDGGVIANLEGGEFVVNKFAMQNEENRNIVESINKGYSPSLSSNNIDILNAIKSMKMYVAVDEINRVGNRVSVVEKRASY